MAFRRILLVASIFFATSELANSALVKRVTYPSGQSTTHPVCCPLFPVIDYIQANLFDGGQCGEDAHSALRLAFHDAIGFATLGGKGGGADGSILAFSSIETAYHANGGTDDIVASQLPVWQATGLSAGDFVHLAAAIGTGNCPGAPRLEYWHGRPAPTAAAPDLTVPEPTDSVSKILARFADAGFTPGEAVELLASHSIAAADVVDPTIPGTPFDSTVGTLSVTTPGLNYYGLLNYAGGTLWLGNGSQPGEVLAPIHGEMRLQSDFAISQDPRTACLWQGMIGTHVFCAGMMLKFKAAMAKLQVLGQIGLVDCSDVIPTPTAFTGDIKYPASLSQSDVQIACSLLPFPSLATVSGPAPTLAPVPA